jgi:uncharacterized membrane protein YeaQ/YmgE (transglycosylase-associated protein family)
MGNGGGIFLLGTALIFLLLAFAAVGLAIGALARWLLPGPDPMGLPATAAFGMAGALIFGLGARMAGLAPLLGYVASVAGAMLLIWFFTRRNAPPPQA